MQVKESTEQKPGKRYKLTVRSAEEAVRVIREKLGENAKVISVRQVGGDGLRRFISSPKLEVVAEIREAQDVKASEENEPVQPDPASVDDNNLIKGEEDFNPSPTSHRPSAKQLEVPARTMTLYLYFKKQDSIKNY
jgi:flagellar biosynthesis protein FlhF